MFGAGDTWSWASGRGGWLEGFRESCAYRVGVIFRRPEAPGWGRGPGERALQGARD